MKVQPAGGSVPLASPSTYGVVPHGTSSSPSSTTFPSSSFHFMNNTNLMSFRDFLEYHQSSWTIFLIYLWYILVGTCTAIIKYFHLNQSQNQSNSPLTILRFLGCVPILIHGYHYLQQKYFPKWRSQPFRLYQIGNMFLITITFLSSSALLISSMFVSRCEFALCVTVELRQLQPYLLLQHIVIPVIAPVLFKAHSAWCSYLTFIISFSVSVVSAIIVNATIPTYFSIAILYLLELIVVYDNEATLRQLYVNYISAEEHLRMKLKTFHERDLLILHGEELSSFYANVAHDMKSPLQGFTIELETLEKHFADPSQSANSSESIVVLKSICSFMLMTINRAIDYSKASSGILLVPILESVNIPDAINWVIKCVSPLNEIPIKVEPLAEFMETDVLTDKHWFMENLLCLVSNALKFTTDGTIIIRCLLAPDISGIPPPRPYSKKDVVPSSLSVLIEVEDSGGDTNIDDLKDVFQPYRQSARREGGTGLGLYSVLKRVEALEGNCGVKSRRDGALGSRFWFSFPYQPNKPPPSCPNYRSDEIRPGSPTACDLQREKTEEEDQLSPTISMKENCKSILLVEDSVLIQKTTSRALRKEGFIVDIARNGLECVNMVKKQKYAFILMDIQMPVMDGIEATKIIRQLELEVSPDTVLNRSLTDDFEYGDIRIPSSHHLIIGVSANSDPSTMKEALDSGMDAFLAKPLSIKLLHDTFYRLTHG